MKSSLFKRLAGAMVLVVSFIFFFASPVFGVEITDQAEIAALGSDLTHPMTELPEGESIFADSKTVFINDANGVENAFDNASLYKPASSWPTRTMCAKGQSYLGIGYTFATPKKIVAYSVAIGQVQWSRGSRAPKTFTLFGTNADPATATDADWTNLGTGTSGGYETVTDWIGEDDEKATKEPETRYFRCQAGSNEGYTSFKWVATAPVSDEKGYLHVSELEFFGTEALTSDKLIISGEPSNMSAVSPDYGMTTGLENDGTRTCSATSPYADEVGTTWGISGYKIYDYDMGSGDKVLSTAAQGHLYTNAPLVSFSYTHGTTARELVWTWEPVSHTVTIDNNTAATITGGGVHNHNAAVTVSVTELPPSSQFLKWTGKLPEGIDITSPTITFTADASYTFIPSFVATYYVSNNGNSTEPYSTWETAATNIEDAVALAQSVADAPAKILIDEGDYKITQLPYLNITNPLQIVGKGADKTIISTAYVYTNASGKTFTSLRRHFHLSNAEALLEGMTIRGGNWQNWDVTNQAKDGEHYDLIKNLKGVGSVYISSGTIRNCYFTANTGNDDAGAVYVAGGLVTNCVFYGNKAYRGNNTGAASGGGLTILGGIVTDCVITNNTASGDSTHARTYFTGAGAVVGGSGILRNSLIAGNKADSTSKRYGAGLSILGNALVENCVISNNYNIQYGAGVYLHSANATLRNCLVTHNTAQDAGGGIYLKSGKVEFCTITENSSANAKGSGIYCPDGSAASVIIKGNIIYGNGLGTSSEAGCNFTGTIPNTYTMNIVSPVGNDTNIDSDPLFTDPNNNDFTPGPGSPAIDGYTDEDAPSVDLINAVRPKDGDGDGTAHPDIGCYEAGGVDDGPLRGTISVSEAAGYDSLTTTLTANLAGAGKENVTYEWNLDGGRVKSGEGATIEAEFMKYGAYQISLKVSPASGESITLHLADPVRVGSRTVWVGNGSGIWPYDSKETATNDVCEAVNSALYVGDTQVEIVVTEGDFPINEKWVVLSANIYLHGENGKENTSLYGYNNNTAYRKAGIYLANPNAIVEDLTIRDCNWDGNLTGVSHGAVLVDAGTIRNCDLVRLRGGHTGGALTVRNGTADNLLIYGCESSGNNNDGACGVGIVHMNGTGILKNSVISNNFAITSAGGIYMSHKDSIVSNCVITANQTGRGSGIYYSLSKYVSGKHHGGVRIEGGLMINCVVKGNCATGRYGGVFITGKDSRMVNCVVAENVARQGLHGGSVEGGGTIINGTIANNGTNTLGISSLTGAAFAVTNGVGHLQNTIVYHNINCESQLVVSEANAVNVTNSCAPELAAGVNGNITDEPRLRNMAKGDYRLSVVSPCIDKGDSTLNTWPKDLYDNDRIFHKDIDIGAHEYHRVHTMLIVK